ncbi:MAG: hypothetical protein JXB48_21140 [Candidatus Latescibacteria bacterium]|nr:hypothetical protein [Candidatus Latescibacterota bacterium]
MDIKELEDLKKFLCTDAHKRIEKIEIKLSWYNTLLISTLVALVLNFIKEILIK